MKIFELTFFWVTLAPSYYWLMYAVAFFYGIWAIKKLLPYNDREREMLFYFVFIGVIIGGRLGNFLFYYPRELIENPLVVLYIWQWWMAFHGWLLWVILAVSIFAKRYKKDVFQLFDALAMIVPVGLFLWRIGNYLNKELLWFSYDWFLAVQTANGSYFPSPLVEAFLEWCVIFVLLNFIYKKSFSWKISALFLIYYWVFRVIVEIWIRQPDSHIWYYLWFLTQWSLLSIPMIIWGILLYIFLWKRGR